MTLAGPANMRTAPRHGDSLEEFNPATYRWNDHYDPKQVIGRFYFNLKPVHAEKYVTPVFGTGPGVHESIRRENPADLLLTTNLQPGELNIYLNFPDEDNYNFRRSGQVVRVARGSERIEVTLEAPSMVTTTSSIFEPITPAVSLAEPPLAHRQFLAFPPRRLIGYIG